MSTLPRRRADFLMEGSRMPVEGPHRWVALVVVTALGYPPYCGEQAIWVTIRVRASIDRHLTVD